jgi:hypothetical protein
MGFAMLAVLSRRPCWWSVIAISAVAGVFVAHAQDLGETVPQEFRVRMLAAQKASLDGNYLESLRQLQSVVEQLEDDLRVKRSLTINHSYLKCMFLAQKAEVLAELGAKKAASSQYQVAVKTLQNQKEMLARKKVPLLSTILNDEKATLEFIEASVQRPSMDFSLGEIGLDERKDSDPFRWRQCLVRCGEELRIARITGGRLAGRQFVELARATMHKPVRPDAPTDDERYTDAGLFLGEAKIAFQQDPIWKRVVDPDNPLAFKMVDDMKALGAEIKLEDEVAVKNAIAVVLRDWIEWRLAQAELQARQLNVDPELGWGFDNAATQFDEMCNVLRLQYKGDDHPALYRVRLSRARWFIFCGLRTLDELDADVAQKREPDGAAAALDRAKKIAKARSYVKDSLLTLKDMVATKRVAPLMEEQCAVAELSALTLQLRLDVLEKKLDDDSREIIKQRMNDLSAKLNADDYRRRANDMVDSFGNPRRPKQDGG